MSRNNGVSIFWIVLNLAVGAMLAIGGIWAITAGNHSGDMASKAIVDQFGSTAGLVFGVIELISGLFIIIETFIGDRLGKFGYILKIIICVVWAVAIILAYLLPSKLGDLTKLETIYAFAKDLIVLCALLVTRS